MATTLSPQSESEPEVPVAKRSWRPGTFRALRHPNYRLYFLGQIISLTGGWIQAAALTWLAYVLTLESRWPALVGAAQVLPSLFLGIWAGGLADRWPRRPLIFLAQAGLLFLALALAGLVLFDLITPTRLLAIALLIGVVNAIDTPARLAFVIDMVGRDDLMNAVALNSLVFNVARAVGPAIGGLFLPRLGVGACFLVNGVTFVAILVALLAMRLPARPARRNEPHARGSWLEGFGHLQRSGLILLLVLAGAMALFGWPVLALLPAVSDQQLLAGERGYAWMLSAVGAGALVGALFVASFGTPARRRMFLGGGVVISCGALLGLAWAISLPVAVICCALSGCGLILFFATGQATMQLGADEHNRGRVMGIWLMVLSGAQPIGNLIAGLGADRYGVSAVLLVQGVGIALAALLVLLVIAGRSPRQANG